MYFSSSDSGIIPHEGILFHNSTGPITASTVFLYILIYNARETKQIQKGVYNS